MSVSDKWDPARIGISMAIFEPRLEDLLAQLDSLEHQSLSEWVCVISSDSDISEIMVDERFQRFFSDSRFKWIQNEKRLGVKKNFEFGIGKLLEEGVDAIAFSDQDDVWKMKKLEVSLQELRRAGRMSVVHSDLDVIAHGRSIGNAWEIENRATNETDFRSLIMCNSVTGCSMLMDAELARRFPTIPDSFEFHDHWYAVMASLHGGVYPIEEAQIEYRIHGENVVGLEAFEGVMRPQKSIESGGLITRTREGALKRSRMEEDALSEAGMAGIKSLASRNRIRSFSNGFGSLWGFSVNWIRGNGALARAYLGHLIGSFLNGFLGLTRNKRLPPDGHGHDA